MFPALLAPMKVSSTCTFPNTNTILQQLWKVMSTNESMLQVDRHVILLETFLSTTGDSVDIADLDLLSSVMVFLVQREGLTGAYHKYFLMIMDTLKHPPTMRKASDEIKYKQHLIQFFSSIGFILLQTKHGECKLKILEILRKIIDTKRYKSSNLVPLKACIHAIEVSDLMDCMSDFIAVSDENIYNCTLYTTLQISRLSKFSCWALLKKNTLDALLLRMITMPRDCRRKVIYTTFQLLWILFGCTPNCEDWSMVSPPSKVALGGLRYVLREDILEQSYTGCEAVDFNNTTSVILKLMHLFPTADYVSSGLLEDIVCFVTMSENYIESTVHCKFKNQQDHFQFQKLMMACLSLSPITPSSVKIFKRYKVAQYLVKMFSVETPSDSKVSWLLGQTIELFHCALRVTSVLFDSLQTQFIEAGIVTKLLSYIELCYIGADQPIEELAHLVIKTLSLLCCRKDNSETTHQTLRDEGAVEVMLKVCELHVKPESPLTILSQSIIFNCLLVLANLIENKIELQKEHVGRVSSLVTALYIRIIKPDQADSLIDNRLTVAAANFAWKSLICNRDNILKFITSGGISLQIDILERGSFSEQLVFLSIISDICEYSQSVPCLLAWQNSGGETILNVLCRIWRAEEERLRVPRREDGCILDIERPLMGDELFAHFETEKSKIVSICDVYGSARPKIYAIIQLLRRHKDVVELGEERYQLLYDRLPLKDKVTMKLVEAYLPLKLGEVWWEISSKQEQAMPLDRYIAETLADKYKQWAMNVQLAQQQLVAESQQREDQRLRALGRGARLTSALDALQEVVAVAHSVDRQLRLLNWHRLQNSILESRHTSAPQDLRPSTHNAILMVNVLADVVLEHEVDD